MDINEARVEWGSLKPELQARGLVLPHVTMLLPDEFKSENASLADIAMDAAGTLTTDPNSALPALLTTTIDPDVIRIVFAKLQMAEILGERKVGGWLDENRMFPVIEETGEVSSYDDYSNNGRVGVNFNYPWFQSYLFQTIQNYGERETERAGLMKINYVGELGKASANLLNRFGNLSYAFGIAGLQNYGILNNPYLSAAITPAVKAWGGTTWFNNGVPAATANEVYNDVMALWNKAVAQTNGTIDTNSRAVLALGPQSMLGLEFANSFGVFVKNLLKEGFPNMEVKQAVQYGAQSSTNSQGFSAIGNYVQLIIKELDGQETAYAAFNEKMRAHKIVPRLSSWTQKMTAGTWGTILRIPAAVASMVGV